MSFLRFFFFFRLVNCIFFFFHLFYALAWSVLATLVRFWFSVFIFFSLRLPFFFGMVSLSLFSFPLQFFSNWPLQGCVLRTTWIVPSLLHSNVGDTALSNRTTEKHLTVLVNRLATTNLLVYIWQTNQLTFSTYYYYYSSIILFLPILSVSSSFFTDRNNFIFFLLLLCPSNKV